MNPPGKIQIPAPNNNQEQEDEDQPEDPGILNEKPIDAHLAKWREFVSSSSIISSPPISELSKAKRRKQDKVHQLHGGRIIRPSGRKDKHSKVCTMRGPRDRRLRLSPKTAIEFYDVQDRLGYDRASKAIDWLMKEAKSAIDALDEPPEPFFTSNIQCNTENHTPLSIKTDQEMLLQETDHDHHIPGFGFFTNGAATTSSTEFRPYNLVNNPSCQEAFTTYAGSSSSNSRTGGVASGDYFSFINAVNPTHFPGSGLGYMSQMFTQREPLQSSVNYYCPISTQFPGLSFSHHDQEGIEKIQVSSNPYSAASFLHYED